MTDSARDEVTVIARTAAAISAILVLLAGVCASLGLVQATGLALLAALAANIAWVAVRPGRGLRWVTPGVIGIAMAAVILAGSIG